MRHLFPLDIVKQYLPCTYRLISTSEQARTSVHDYFAKRLSMVEEAINQNGVFSAKTTVHDLLFNALEGDAAAIAFLDFIDKTVEALRSRVPNQMIPSVRDLSLKLFTTFNASDSQYKNHFAEIAAANAILSEATFTLKTIERLLPNGKRFDFAFGRDGSEVLTEVYNIDFELEKIESADGFTDFLRSRLERKLRDKLIGIPEPWPSFTMIPVLWGQNARLRPFAVALDAFHNAQVITPFMMFAQYRDTSGHLVFAFQPVLQFLDQVERIENEST
jgi:hypothetical protein